MSTLNAPTHAWKAVELIADYWIILLDDDGYTEYQDEVGDNLMFNTKQQAQAFIDSLKEQA